MHIVIRTIKAGATAPTAALQMLQMLLVRDVAGVAFVGCDGIAAGTHKHRRTCATCGATKRQEETYKWTEIQVSPISDTLYKS